jgi:mono/diheme cytochrome c family protein
MMISTPGKTSPNAAIAALAFGLAVLSATCMAADAARGKSLYETSCGACHEDSVHKRSSRKAKSFDAVRAQVARWSGEVGGKWSEDEIDDVAFYLNQRYYGFLCPPSVCKPNHASVAR